MVYSRKASLWRVTSDVVESYRDRYGEMIDHEKLEIIPLINCIFAQNSIVHVLLFLLSMRIDMIYDPAEESRVSYFLLTPQLLNSKGTT